MGHRNVMMILRGRRKTVFDVLMSNVFTHFLCFILFCDFFFEFSMVLLYYFHDCLGKLGFFGHFLVYFKCGFE